MPPALPLRAVAGSTEGSAVFRRALVLGVKLWNFTVALLQVERRRHRDVHAVDASPDRVRPFSVEAGDVEVIDVLAVHLAVELTRVFGLNALRLVDSAGRVRVVQRPTQLSGRQGAGMRVRAVDGCRGRRLCRLRHPGVVVDRDSGYVSLLAGSPTRIEGQLGHVNEVRSAMGRRQYIVPGRVDGSRDSPRALHLETVRCDPGRHQILPAPRIPARATLVWAVRRP